MCAPINTSYHSITESKIREDCKPKHNTSMQLIFNRVKYNNRKEKVQQNPNEIQKIVGG